MPPFHPSIHPISAKPKTKTKTKGFRRSFKPLSNVLPNALDQKRLSFTHKPRSSSVSQLIDVEIFEHASSSSGRFDGEGDAVMCPRRNRAVVPLMEQHF
jgi:hypothetical protein